MAAKRLSREEFLQKLRLIHGDKYDYSETAYNGHRASIIIKCPQHGAFVQLASNHLAGTECPQCASIALDAFYRQKSSRIAASNKRKNKAKLLGKILRSDNAVYLSCLIHGISRRENYLYSKDNTCPFCKKNIITNKLFIERAQKVHGLRYKYDNSNYLGDSIKIEISCQIHGSFLQRPFDHLKGAGCKKCATLIQRWNRLNNCGWSRARWIARASSKTPVLYLIKMTSLEECFYKIGITMTSVKERFKDAIYKNYIIDELLIIKGEASEVWDWEKKIKTLFKPISYTPKQKFAGSSECFSDSDSIIKALNAFV